MDEPERRAGRRERALAALGLTVRSGDAAIGTRAVLEAAAEGELELLVVAEDATDNALHRLRGALRTVPTVRLGRKGELGRRVGRGPVVAVGVTDRGLAAKIREDAAEGDPSEGTARRKGGAAADGSTQAT